MTEKEFREEASKKSLREENISSAIQMYQTGRVTLPNLELDENLINWMLKAQEKNDNRSDEFVTLD